MAFKKTDKEDTSLATAEDTAMSTPGSFMPSDLDEFLQSDGGFAQIATVMVGDPADGKIPRYMGKLIGPGQDIEIESNGARSTLKTWAFHPMVKTNGQVGVAENVTQIVPSPYVLNAALARVHSECEKHNKAAIVAVFYRGKGKTRKGNPLNEFDLFEKYIPNGAK